MNSDIDTLRLFVALRLPESDAARFVALQQTVAEVARLNEIRLRLARSDQFHVTLAFLGNVPSTRVRVIVDATRDVATKHSCFELAPVGLVAFPSRRKARVIAVAFEDNSGTLAALVPALHTRLRECGCTLESRAFRAHVTLARLASPQNIEIESLSGIFPKDPARCTKLHVFQSILSSRGAEYHSRGCAEFHP